MDATNNETKGGTDLSGMRFGIEIETSNMGYEAGARAVAKGLADFGIDGVTVSRSGGYYQTWVAVMPDGRKWKSMSDGSTSGAEIVSPVLVYGELDLLQTVVRALRAAGGQVNSACGIHIHVDGDVFLAQPRKLANLIKLTNQQEALIKLAVGRDNHWAKSVNPEFLTRLERTRGRSTAAIRRAWYETLGNYGTESHYHESRYHGVNLHCLFNGIGTVEYRYFGSSLHAGRVKTYVQFVLALTKKALDARACASRKRTVKNGNTKYAFRTFMLRLGLIGDEFKTCRLHMMKNLSGSASWSDPADAVAAREAARSEAQA